MTLRNTLSDELAVDASRLLAISRRGAQPIDVNDVDRAAVALV